LKDTTLPTFLPGLKRCTTSTSPLEGLFTPERNPSSHLFLTSYSPNKHHTTCLSGDLIRIRFFNPPLITYYAWKLFPYLRRPVPLYSPPLTSPSRRERNASSTR